MHKIHFNAIRYTSLSDMTYSLMYKYSLIECNQDIILQSEVSVS